MTSHSRVADLGELIAVVPYLLGFHPRRSVVCVSLAGGALGPVQRVDLPDDAGEVPPAVLARVTAGLSGEAAVLLGWEDSPGESLAALAGHLDLCTRAGVAVGAVAVVRGDHWFRLDEGRPGPGAPVPDPADVPVVAEFVGRGMRPVRSRADLEDALCSDRGDHDAVSRSLERRRRRRSDVSGRRERDGIAAWAGILLARRAADDRGAGPDRLRLDLDDDGVAAAVDVLDDLRVRDAVAVRLAPGVVPEGVVDPGVRSRLDTALTASLRGGARAVAAEDMAARLSDLVGRVPRHERAGVLSLVALHSWWQGDGARAEIAARLARRADPMHSLASLVEAIVVSGRSARQVAAANSTAHARPA